MSCHVCSSPDSTHSAAHIQVAPSVHRKNVIGLPHCVSTPVTVWYPDIRSRHGVRKSCHDNGNDRVRMMAEPMAVLAYAPVSKTRKEQNTAVARSATLRKTLQARVGQSRTHTCRPTDKPSERRAPLSTALQPSVQSPAGVSLRKTCWSAHTTHSISSTRSPRVIFVSHTPSILRTQLVFVSGTPAEVAPPLQSPVAVPSPAESRTAQKDSSLKRTSSDTDVDPDAIRPEKKKRGPRIPTAERRRRRKAREEEARLKADKLEMS